MTSITLSVTGAHAWATVSGPLTSGMVGIPVTIEYDEAWHGLTKNLMCRCSPWGSNDGEIRTILNVGEVSAVAHEVMQPDMYLHLGVEGFSADGTLVIPTTWARCGKIEYGANTSEDLSADPELPIWNQLQTEVEQIKRDGFTQEQRDEIQAYVQSASQAASSAEHSKDNAVAASNAALSNAAAARNAADMAQTYAESAHASANSAANLANGALQAQRAAETAAERAEAAAGSETSSQYGGLTTAQINALDGMFRVCTFVKDDVSAEYSAFREAFGLDSSGGDDSGSDSTDKTLTSISAVYSGGDVPVGTAVTALTGIVVTAHYSDGSTETVTGYALSGTIAEGSNTITVSYGGMTATIAVVGVAEGSDLEQYEYTIAGADNLDDSGGILAGPYNYTDYIQIDPDYASVTLATYLTAPPDTNTTVYSYIQWFNGDTFISRPAAQVVVMAGQTVGLSVNTAPDGATKFRISVQNNCERFELYKGEVSAEEVA